MATFRVGQRVKKIADTLPHEKTSLWDPLANVPIGSEGVIGTMPGHPGNRGLIGVLWDAFRSAHYSGEWLYYPHQLAPLLDPKADEFIESIKRLKPYEEPKVTPNKVPVTINSEAK